MSDIVVLRCKACGDTFSVHEGEVTGCPSCGSDECEVAREPFL